MSEPEKFDLRSMDIAKEQKEKLRQLFPEAFTEEKIDFEKLKLTLGESIEIGKERYGMNWPGKADCFKIIQNPSIGTLKPCPNESVNFEKTENIFIEGDNLEVLKLLQKSYYGKVKMIYIDPPYNTGNDFIYPDDYTENLITYLQYTGQVDAEGKKFSTNTDTEGRFHTKWINMMYPRLFFAKNMLRKDGVIFISIDDSEVANLRKVCDEIFGEECFVGSIAWKKTSGDNKPSFAFTHDNILIYGRESKSLPRVGLSEDQLKQYSNPDNDPRDDWAESDYRCKWNKHERPNLYYGIKNPNTGELIYPDTHSDSPRVWGCSEDTHIQNEKNGLVWWGINGASKEPKKKRFLNEHKGVNTRSVWLDAGTNDDASRELSLLFPEILEIFDTPKPTKLLMKMFNLMLSSNESQIALDFFAGSASIADALLKYNIENNVNHHFIAIQLPEKIDPSKKKQKEIIEKGYLTVADIGKERIRRVIKNIDKEKDETLFKDKKLDLGFKVFKLDKSNFKIWDAEKVSADKQALEKQLELHIDHIDPKATQEDILFEILLKAGFELTTKIEKIELAGKAVYSIEDGAMLVCLEKELTKEVIKAMAEKQPSRVICLDQGFINNDQLKTNAVQIMKTKGVDDFRTV